MAPLENWHVSLLINTFKALELSGLFVCLEGLVKIFSACGTEEIAGLWFAREGGGGGSTQADTDPSQQIFFQHFYSLFWRGQHVMLDLEYKFKPV